MILNFINLSSLYFRHNTYPRFIHTPVASGPLAWTFVAIYWNGALMIPHPHHLVPRIFGNIFIWAILAYGLFFIIIYKVCDVSTCCRSRLTGRRITPWASRSVFYPRLLVFRNSSTRSLLSSGSSLSSSWLFSSSQLSSSQSLPGLAERLAGDLRLLTKSALLSLQRTKRPV